MAYEYLYNYQIKHMFMIPFSLHKYNAVQNMEVKSIQYNNWSSFFPPTFYGSVSLFNYRMAFAEQQ